MHTIQSASEKTGLSPDVIRIWERRYQAVTPERTVSNQRLYSDADIHRLLLLKRLTDLGRRIGAIAQLSDQELSDAFDVEVTLNPIPVSSASANASVNNVSSSFVDEALSSILQLDPQSLDRVFNGAVVQLGMVGFMTKVVHPLMATVGDRWRRGDVRTCQEHFASAYVRSFIGKYILEANCDPEGPRVVVATPPGHLHELGATMAAVTASLAGWNVIYLGPNVPYEEIIFAADCKDAAVVAISLSYPADDPKLPSFLNKLHSQLRPGVAKVVGGASVAYYTDSLMEIGAIQVDSLEEFSGLLDQVRLRAGG